MKSKKSTKVSKQDESWQKKVEERVKSEKVLLDHPVGKEQFDHVIKKALKKKQ
jgi:hypothetical protein